MNEMKKLLGLMIACVAFGCQKAELVENADPNNGRNATEEKTDTIIVTPSVDTSGWEGSIDVGFGFGQ